MEPAQFFHQMFYLFLLFWRGRERRGRGTRLIVDGLTVSNLLVWGLMGTGLSRMTAAASMSASAGEWNGTTPSKEGKDGKKEGEQPEPLATF